MTMVPPLQGVVAFFDLVENHDSLIAQIRELGAEVDDFICDSFLCGFATKCICAAWMNP